MLAIRLMDGEGHPVLDDNGQEIPIPIPETGPEERSATIWAWEQIYTANFLNNCVDPLPPALPADTVRRLANVSLSPNSQYTAIIVSDSRPVDALATWGFTTSRYATFTDLVTRDREIAPAVRIDGGAPLLGEDFDACARATGIDIIAYSDHLRITPILTADETGYVALLLESPEPLEAETRLGITVDLTDTLLRSNVDGTRLFVIPQIGTFQTRPAFSPPDLETQCRFGFTNPELSTVTPQTKL